jgi:DNA (cytosine-5)-methyltransferase 1
VTIRFVDLFSGIGGFHLALANDPLIGGECVFASDIDEDCRVVYRAAFGQQPWGDVRQITGLDREGIRARIPEHDLLCAGFPCQPFSKSGQQRGIDEARGTLFYDICRILEVRRPRYFLLENVVNLVGPRHRSTWRTIVALLRSLGYAVSDEPTLMSPHLLPPGLGAPQHRSRVFIPGVYVGSSAAAERLSLPAFLPARPYPDWNPDLWRVLEFVDGAVADAPSSSGMDISREKRLAIDIWTDFASSVEGPLPGHPIWLDVWHGLLRETEAHPAWKNGIIRRNQEFFDRENDAVSGWARRHAEIETFTPSNRKFEWQAGTGSRDLWAHAIQFRPSGIRVRPLTYLPALVAITQTSILGPWKRYLAPPEAARLQGFPTDFPLPASGSVAFRQLGNAVSVDVTRFIARGLLAGPQAEMLDLIPVQWRSVLAE